MIVGRKVNDIESGDLAAGLLQLTVLAERYMGFNLLSKKLMAGPDGWLVTNVIFTANPLSFHEFDDGRSTSGVTNIRRREIYSYHLFSEWH